MTHRASPISSTTITHPELAFDRRGGSIHFLSIPTHLLEATMRYLEEHGFRGELLHYCPPTVTPENAMIIATAATPT